MAARSIRTAFFELVRDQALEGRYPSPAMLDRLEAAIPDPEVAEEYIRTLIDRLSEERFSSPTMMDRIAVLIAGTG